MTICEICKDEYSTYNSDDQFTCQNCKSIFCPHCAYRMRNIYYNNGKIGKCICCDIYWLDKQMTKAKSLLKCLTDSDATLADGRSKEINELKKEIQRIAIRMAD